MEFYAIIKHNDKIYSWVEHPGHTCISYCDLADECYHDNHKDHLIIRELCEAMRSSVGSVTTHRFKEVHLET
jgi:hypothetical protein